ncbi:MAG: hypothetical protein IKF58_06930 [Bacillus sp. (in: Bacteria)]|nr:hypothetical protein [Bacillus sp. (in: firmicutes)]
MTGTTRKNYRMTDECLQVIKETQERHRFATETQTLHHIIMDYQRRRQKDFTETDKDAATKEIAARVKEELDPLLRQIRSGVKETERQTYITLDAVNTILYDSSATFLMAASGQLRHKVVCESEENYKKMLQRRKQIRDNRK